MGEKGKLIIIVAVVALAALLLAFGRPLHHTNLGNTLVITTASPPDALDPGKSYMVVSWQTMVNVYDGLLTYKKASGAEGSQMVPDLATAVPKAQDGGRTWVFHMRTGVMWGPPLKRQVEPSDIKYAIERDFRMASPGEGFYTGITGATAFANKKTKTITGIIANDSAHTITFHLDKPDATFLQKVAMPFAFAVPKGTPAKDMSNAGFVPATGPYMFTSYVPQRMVTLKRNPNFKSWSPNVPKGNVDSIQIKIGVSAENAVTMIQQGKVDFSFDPIPLSKLPTLMNDQSLQPQMHTNVQAETSYIWMNTTLPPFNNVKMRQAVNWAIDRKAMVKLSGGLGVPSETILPPTMPGYEEHHLYPRPDMNKARELVKESGIKPGKIDIWCMGSLTIPQYLQSVLDQLGFDAQVKCVDASGYYTLVGNQSTKARIGFALWSQDFPDGSDFIDVLLNGKRVTPTNNNNYSSYAGSDKAIAKANALMDPKAREKAWGALDKQIMMDAPWAPFMHEENVSFTSKRLGNYVYSPVYGMLFDLVTVDSSGTSGAAAAAGASTGATTTAGGGEDVSGGGYATGGGTYYTAPVSAPQTDGSYGVPPMPTAATAPQQPPTTPATPQPSTADAMPTALNWRHQPR